MNIIEHDEFTSSWHINILSDNLEVTSRTCDKTREGENPDVTVIAPHREVSLNADNPSLLLTIR